MEKVKVIYAIDGETPYFYEDGEDVPEGARRFVEMPEGSPEDMFIDAWKLGVDSAATFCAGGGDKETMRGLWALIEDKTMIRMMREKFRRENKT